MVGVRAMLKPTCCRYYEYTRQTADLQIQSKQNGTKCAAPKPPASGSNSSGRNVGAIVGGVIGGVGLLLIAALVFWFSRRRRSKEIVDLTEENAQDMTFEPYVDRPTTFQPNEPSYGEHVYSPGRDSSSELTSTSAYVPLVQRPVKATLVASSPPNRDEASQPMMNASSLALPEDRHEDSTELTNAFHELGRSSSGRLPPSYPE
ncbi:hypothetical protein FRC09_000455 [Ceratobasidium sp. 395]|nr:hypothetical protein FRC09_000455 [Ceratobasidium sp. 395]